LSNFIKHPFIKYDKNLIITEEIIKRRKLKKDFLGWKIKTEYISI
jgi:hypothetical protein